jgi:hypothetical protein
MQDIKITMKRKGVYITDIKRSEFMALKDAMKDGYIVAVKDVCPIWDGLNYRGDDFLDRVNGVIVKI